MGAVCSVSDIEAGSHGCFADRAEIRDGAARSLPIPSPLCHDRAVPKRQPLHRLRTNSRARGGLTTTSMHPASRQRLPRLGIVVARERDERLRRRRRAAARSTDRPSPSGSVRSRSTRRGGSDVPTPSASAIDAATDTRAAGALEQDAHRAGHELVVLDDEDVRRGRAGHVSAVVGLLERNREEEPAARAELALDPDPSAVQLDELARDRETESRAVMRARRRRVDLRELAEDQIVMLRRDADAGVADFDEQRTDTARRPSSARAARRVRRTA